MYGTQRVLMPKRLPNLLGSGSNFCLRLTDYRYQYCLTREALSFSVGVSFGKVGLDSPAAMLS